LDTQTTLNRRDFLRLALVAGGAVAISPLLKACTALGTLTTTPSPTPAPDLLADLRGLDVDAFFQQSFRRWVLRDPETITSLGLTAYYGIDNADLTDISEAYIRETQAIEAGILNLLRLYDRATLTGAQSLTANIYDWFLDDLVRGHPFMYYDYPINPIITSITYNLYMLFTAYHPLENHQDAVEYISRLAQVGRKVTDLMGGLERREKHGVILPAFIFPYVLPDIEALAQGSVRAHPYYTAFTSRLQGVNSDERSTLEALVEEQVQATVMPAYGKLSSFLKDQQIRGPEGIGVWHFPDGEAYYAQSLRRQTTTGLTVEEIHALGLQHVDRIHAEMRTLFAALGYPAGEDIPGLVERLTENSGTYRGEEAVAAYKEAIATAEAMLPQAFSTLPHAGVIVVGGEDGDFYMPAAYNGSRPGIFYARTTSSTPRFGVKSLAFHEAIPGHHLQIALAQEIPNLPDLRRGMQFNAYTEGWALYAERLMAELGVYTDDLQSDLGRLQMEVFRAARLVVDTGIHAMHWSFDQAVNYLVAVTGFTMDYARREVTRYTVWPGQAVSYYIGFLKILDLRQKAQDAFGAKFDLKAFHQVILANGSVPILNLEKLVDEYIQARAK